jgi:pyruvate/2-oxoglutarate dehydrogenase complex dihydrolipoamide dehydrogenase (E3) component
VKIDQLKAYADTKQRITIVGSGFIGVEIGLEFAKSGKEVTIIDGAEHMLHTAFDAELASQAEELAKKVCITLELGDFVDSVEEGTRKLCRFHRRRERCRNGGGAPWRQSDQK